MNYEQDNARNRDDGLGEARQVSLEMDAHVATIRALRREVNDLRNRCDELFHALACALAIPLNDDGDALHQREQKLLDWARSFMSQKQAHDVALVASRKYAATHDWVCPLNEPGCKANCGAYACGN